jgi:hypothetical protein
VGDVAVDASRARICRVPLAVSGQVYAGEELNAAEVTDRGLLGDRAYALLDRSDGKVASDKNPRKWPQLFDFRAAFVEAPRSGEQIPPVRITLPDGPAQQHGNGCQPDPVGGAQAGRDARGGRAGSTGGRRVQVP